MTVKMVKTNKIEGKQKQPPKIRYKIKNTFLPTNGIEKIIVQTLNMYRKGEDITNSPLAEWGRNRIKDGGWWYGCEEAKNKEVAIQLRQMKVIALYEDIKANGYNGSEISVFFDKDGSIHTYDGFHRLCIMKYVGLKTLVNVVISHHDPDPARRGDFPLVAVITKMNSGRNLYQPCSDPRVKDFHVWRKDSSERLAYITQHLAGKTVLDIGCSEGYFSRELAKKGYRVTALDSDPRRVAITRYLSIINNLRINCQVGKWEDYLQPETKFDNVIFISVFHHNILSVGVEDAFKLLQRFRGKATRVFFESPVSSDKISWVDKSKKGLYKFTEHQFKTRIEKEMNMKTVVMWHGIRPIYLLKKA